MSSRLTCRIKEPVKSNNKTFNYSKKFYSLCHTHTSKCIRSIPSTQILLYSSSRPPLIPFRINSPNQLLILISNGVLQTTYETLIEPQVRTTRTHTHPHLIKFWPSQPRLQVWFINNKPEGKWSHTNFIMIIVPSFNHNYELNNLSSQNWQSPATPQLSSLHRIIILCKYYFSSSHLQSSAVKFEASKIKQAKWSIMCRIIWLKDNVKRVKVSQ